MSKWLIGHVLEILVYPLDRLVVHSLNVFQDAIEEPFCLNCSIKNL